jgi:release factor glutamine methyltransferase
MIVAGASVATALRVATAMLAGSEARREAEILIAHALAWPRARLFAHGDDCLNAEQATRCQTLLVARQHGQPIAYLLGEREFYSLRLRVTPAVLIPRHETEMLVDWALAVCPDRARGYRLLDLGTGSGAIALALASARPLAEVWAVDASAAALVIAADNAQRLAIGNVQFCLSDWFSALPSAPPFDLIAANPPYVAAADPHLDQGDLRFEPAQALTPGGDGLSAIRAITASATAFLRPGGHLLLEHGHDQGAAVRELLRVADYAGIDTRRDAGGHERVTSATRPE